MRHPTATVRKQLTPRQERFVQEYVSCLNATQAAIQAGYSPHTARQMGYENLTKPYIRSAVARAQSAYSERVSIDRDWLMAQLWSTYEGARAERRFSVAVRSLDTMAQLLGLFPHSRR